MIREFVARFPVRAAIAMLAPGAAAFADTRYLHARRSLHARTMLRAEFDTLDE